MVMRRTVAMRLPRAQRGEGDAADAALEGGRLVRHVQDERRRARARRGVRRRRGSASSTSSAAGGGAVAPLGGGERRRPRGRGMSPVRNSRGSASSCMRERERPPLAAAPPRARPLGTHSESCASPRMRRRGRARGATSRRRGGNRSARRRQGIARIAPNRRRRTCAPAAAEGRDPDGEFKARTASRVGETIKVARRQYIVDSERRRRGARGRRGRRGLGAWRASARRAAAGTTRRGTRSPPGSRR